MHRPSEPHRSPRFRKTTPRSALAAAVARSVRSLTARTVAGGVFVLAGALVLGASVGCSAQTVPPPAVPPAAPAAVPPAGPAPGPVAPAPKPSGTPEESPAMNTFHDLTANSLEGAPTPLSAYRGKVVLVVNVASECGFTPQYAGLEKLWRDHRDFGFAVLAFPSNEFGGQEPGTAAEIRAFCTAKYSVTFPVFEKVRTKNGAGQSPVYAFLNGATGKEPVWNFCKYLVGKDGKVIGFWNSRTAPDAADLKEAIDAALKS